MSEAPRSHPVAGFFGAALIAIGALMMVLCGGCGAVFLLVYLADGIAHPNDLPLAFMPIVVGGMPALIGLGLFLVGRNLRRGGTGPRPPPASPPPR
jgi:hypothetical protein